MAARENKTKPTQTPVSQFVASLEPAGRRMEAATLIEMMERATGEKPKMWGPSIIGFGKVAYAYESGRTGETPVISFSPRKASLVLYVGKCLSSPGRLLDRLGKHTTGKACLYVRRLDDVDLEVVREIIAAEVAAVRADRKL